MSDFGETFSPVAAKEHRCIWCYWRIPKGEKHKLYKGVYDGEWQNWRMHNECYEEQQDQARDGDTEFTPGCANPPERIRQIYEVKKPA